jgi:hypothetical protein
MALGAAHDRVDARHQFVLVEGLGHGIVGAEAQALDLVLDAGKPGEPERMRIGVLALETRKVLSTSWPDMSSRLMSSRMMS